MTRTQNFVPATEYSDTWVKPFVGSTSHAEIRALFMLTGCTSKRGVSTKELCWYCAVMNAPDVIKQLRDKGLEIPMTLYKVRNRRGEETTAGYYKLTEDDKLKVMLWLIVKGGERAVRRLCY